MSVFQVRLVSPVQGAGYAKDPSVVAGVSGQKTMEVNGPNLTRRRLFDGETFTSSNYWKRFAPISEGGSMPEDLAFIHIVTDDGSPYSDKDKGLNKFAKVVPLTVAALSDYADNVINIVGTYGGVATSCTITTNHPISARLNSSSTAELDIAVGSVTFDNQELPLTSLEFAGGGSGQSNATVQVTLAIEVVSAD